jgi:hypothetical protein
MTGRGVVTVEAGRQGERQGEEGIACELGEGSMAERVGVRADRP